jgi:predicted membrane protein
VAGGLRRTVTATVSVTLLVIGALLLLFPHVMSIVAAAISFWLALGFGLYLFQQRRSPEGDGSG